MYLEDLRRQKKLIGTIVLIVGIISMVIAIISGKILVPQIKAFGMLKFINNKESLEYMLLTVFNAGFPIGAGISVVGAAILSDASRKRIWWYAWLILLSAVIMSIIPVVFGSEHSLNYYSICGIIVIILFLLFSWFWSRNRHKIDDKSQIAEDLKMAGYLFFLLASWETFRLVSFPVFSLYPEKIMAFKTLPYAIAQSKLILALFVTAWLFTFIGYNYNNRINIKIRKALKKLKLFEDK